MFQDGEVLECFIGQQTEKVRRELLFLTGAKKREDTLVLNHHESAVKEAIESEVTSKLQQRKRSKKTSTESMVIVQPSLVNRER